MSENETGIKVYGSLGISGSAEVEATGGGEYGAIYTASGITFADTHEITEPADAVVDGKVIKSGGAAATHVVIKPYQSYEVWVNGKQINEGNKTDVLSDGTVSFDPSTNTLTLSGANLTDGYHASASAIVSTGLDLTITGTGTATGDNCGIFVLDVSGGGSLTLDNAQITATGGVSGIFADKDITILGDTTNVEAKAKNDHSNAIYSKFGSIFINGGTVTAGGDSSTCVGVSVGDSGGKVVIADTHYIKTPDGGKLSADEKTVCESDGTSYATNVVITKKTPHTVIFDTDGGSLVPSQTVIPGGCAVKPTDKPIKEKREFWNWYADPGRTTLFDFSQPILSDTTIYAKWVLVSDSFTLEGWYAEDNSDGTYTLNASKMEAGFVEGSTPLSYSVSPLSDNKTEFTGVVLSEGPVSGVAYYFKVQIEDTVGIEGNTEVFFSYDIPSNLTIDVEGADVQYVEMSHSPGGKYLSIIFSYAETKYTVDFDTDGGSAVEDQTIRSGECAAKPTDPTKEGYVFGGWYKDSSLTTEFDFSQPITSDTTVYAKWDKDTGADPVIPPYFPAFSGYPVYPVYPLPVIWPQPPVQTTPAVPAAPTVPSAPAPAAAPAPASAPAHATETDGLTFTDVPDNTDMYDIVKYVYDGDIMQGVSDTEFGPYGELTRGMIVTILYRIEGRPAADYSGAFEDVPVDAWFTAGVEWAAQSGIVLGYGDGRFAPDESVTREQLAAILYRYAGWKGCDVETADVAAADAGDISDWAAGAVGWAVGNGVITASEGELRPADNALRWEVASAVRALLEIAAK